MSRKRKFIGLLSIFILLYVVTLVYLISPMVRDGHHQRPLRIDTLTSRVSGDGKSMILHIEGDGFNRETEVALVHDLGNHRAMAASVNTLGAITDMAFSGDIAYLANRDKGLQTVDFSTPLKPVLQNTLYQSLSPQKIALGKQKFWLALGREGVTALPYDCFDQMQRVKNPTDIVKSTRVDLTGYALDLVLLDDDTACVALAREGICFVTVNVQNEIKTLTTLPLPGHATRVVRSGKTIYVANPQEGLQIVDASDLTKPRLVKTLIDFGGVGNIAISGNAAYVAGKGNFAILDISTPENPTTLGSIDFIDTINVAHIDLGDRKAYLSNRSGILIIDVEVPSSPFVSDWIDIRSPRKVVARGDRLLIAQGENGLRIIDRKKLSKTSPNIFTSRTKTQDMLAHRGLAYLASGAKGIEIVDIDSEPAQSLAVLPIPGYVRSIARHEQTLYLASLGAGVLMLDIAEPAHPRPAGAIRGSEAAYQVRVSGEKAFILQHVPRPAHLPASKASATSKLQIYDLTVSPNPALLGEKEFQHQAVNMVVDGNLVYLACNQKGVVIVDVSDPQRPREVSTAALPWPQQDFAHSRDIAVRDGIAYVANGNEGVQVFDMGNPEKPKLVRSVKTPGFANAVALSGNSLYVSDNEKTLLTLDVSEPAKTRITGALDLALVPRKIALAGESVYLVSSLVPLMKVPLPVAARRVKTGDSNKLSATFACSDIPQNAIVQLINGPDIVSYPVELGCPAETKP